MASDGPPEKKRKLSNTSGEPSAEPGLQQKDFVCPICFEVWDEVYVTVCGHSFCFQCISKVLGQSPQCPVCKTNLPTQNSVHPNFSLHDIVTKYRQQSVPSPSAPKVPEVRVIHNLMRQIGDHETLKQLLSSIQEQLQNSDKQERYLCSAVLLDFLEHTKEVLLQDLEKVQSRLRLVEKDIEQYKQAKLPVIPDPEMSVVAASSPCTSSSVPPATPDSPSVVPSHSPLPQSIACSSFSVAGTSDAGSSTSTVPLCLGTQEALSRRKMRVEANISDILCDYFETRSTEDSLDQFSDGLYRFTRYSNFRELSQLIYTDPTLNASVVSGIEFDKDGEYIAVAGIAKRIKIFNYHSVTGAVDYTKHFPEHDLTWTSKFSSLCYSPYHKSQLVSSDYDGVLCVWDTSRGSLCAKYKEHEKRVWSVSYNPTEPDLFASGSDDCTVKLWSSHYHRCCCSIPAKGNVCCVRFHPTNHDNLAYGSADHMVRYMDIRKPTEPLAEFKGHRKPVSFIQFINSQEIVSASTDSELKLWNLDKGIVRTYKGHVNEKNFVGLTVTPHFIACGSENNSFYVYSKQVSNHMLKYTFSGGQNMLHAPQPGTSSAPENGEVQPVFVSSVRWRKDSNVILAANSQGTIKVLEMC